MELNEYQKQALVSALYPNLGENPIYPTLGLVGEAGEVAEKVKKVLRDKGGDFDQLSKEELKKEMGDVLWYLSQLSFELGFNLDEVAKANLSKLSSRLKRNKISGEGDNR